MVSQEVFDETKEIPDPLLSGGGSFKSTVENTKTGATFTGISGNVGMVWTYGGSAFSKRLLDIIGSATLLAILAPLFVVVVLILGCSTGSIFFSHERVGRYGKPFFCLKFRTMVPDAQLRLAALLRDDPTAASEWEQHRKLRNDPRVTRLGRILRTTSLDELPQLVNVLRGDMSLVGPRPVTPSELEKYYGDDARAYLSVRPGITGLWQISGRSSTDYSERVKLDAAYVRASSLRGDVRILLATPVAVLTRRGAL